MSSDILLLQEHETDRQLIGKGGFGRVFKVFNNLDNQYYAIKQIKVTENNIANALKEIRILASVSHPHIIRYCHSWISSSPYQGEDQEYLSDEEYEEEDRMVVHKGQCYFFNIQMEYCFSTLRKYLLERTSIDVSICSNIVYQITEGLCFLHMNSIIHRDLKPDNVLISSFQPLCVKITDFGLAKKISLDYNNSYDASSYAGSFLYSAPEQLETKNYSYASDVYSLGILIYELQHLYHTDMERVLSIQNLKKVRNVEECIYFKSLIMEMTEIDPLKRPSVSVIRNQYFINIKDPVVMCRDIVWEIIVASIQLF